MKVMNKRRIKMKSAIDLCWNERVLLAKIKSPFVVRVGTRVCTAPDPAPLIRP
jgi:hypothetical protein